MLGQIVIAVIGGALILPLILAFGLFFSIFSQFGPIHNLEAAFTYDGHTGILVPVGLFALCVWNLAIGLFDPREDGWAFGSIVGLVIGTILFVILGMIGVINEWGALLPFIAAGLGSLASTLHLARS